jgi:hypothetical protein
MAYLTVQGRLMTYLEYKELIARYKKHGINQFLNIYLAHKDRQIKAENLHWGDEIEYTLFYFNQDT